MEDRRSSNQLCYLFTFHTRLVIYGNISVVVVGNLSVIPSALMKQNHCVVGDLSVFFVCRLEMCLLVLSWLILRIGTTPFVPRGWFYLFA